MFARTCLLTALLGFLPAIGLAQEPQNLMSPIDRIHARRFGCIRIVTQDMLNTISNPPGQTDHTGTLLELIFGAFTNDIKEELAQGGFSPARLNDVELTPMSSQLNFKFISGRTPSRPGGRPEFGPVSVASVETAFASINQTPAARDNIRVVVVSCHGRRSDLMLDGVSGTEPMPRSRLEQLVTAGGAPHLAVLIVDACHSGVPSDRTIPAQRHVGSVWKSLYFGHQGFVNLVSCNTDQEAIIAGGQSLFLVAFTNVFRDWYARSAFNPNLQQLILWEQFFDVLKVEYEIVCEEEMAKWFAPPPAAMAFLSQRATRFPANFDDLTDNQKKERAYQDLSEYRQWKSHIAPWQEQCKRMSRDELAGRIIRATGAGTAAAKAGHAEPLTYDRLSMDEQRKVRFRIQGPPTPGLGGRWQINTR